MEAKTKVDAERFGNGLTYEQYVASIENNREDFQKHYDSVQLSPSEREFFAGLGSKLGTRIKFLALAEDWCPDVARGLPVAARIAEASPDIELRVFPRDENLDIMDQFLHQGQFRSIPTFVFFDEKFNVLGRWAERPASANAIAREVQEMQVQQNLPELEARKLRRQKMAEVYASKLAPEIVREIKEVLSSK
ncbi:MAG: thioredoxin family protein [Chloroflexi bacterium]|nr:thioredoxin family protein [Chloroflexota bacterium]